MACFRFDIFVVNTLVSDML